MTNSEKLAALFVGIDVSSRNNYYYVMNFYGDKLLSFSAPNNHPGTESAGNRLAECLLKNNLTHIVVAMESTGFYGWHVANAMSAHERLRLYEPLVYCLNPTLIKNYKKTFTDIGKTDPLDAMAIADYARVGKIQSKPWRGADFMPLQRLTRQRFHIVENLTREKNYLLSNIFIKFSEFAVAEDKPFSNSFGATATAVLTEFLSTEEIAGSSIDDLVTFVMDRGKNRFPNPDATAKLLQRAARDSYRLDKALSDPLNVAIAMSLDQIKFLEKQIKEIDKVIARTIQGLYSNSYKILSSIKGIGNVFASGIIAEVGDIVKFDNQAALAKFAGLVWGCCDSGNFSSEDNFMTKQGNKYLRYYLIEATALMVRYHPEYKAFYERKYNEAAKHKHKRALALTARKFVRLVFALLRKNQLFTSREAAGYPVTE